MGFRVARVGLGQLLENLQSLRAIDYGHIEVTGDGAGGVCLRHQAGGDIPSHLRVARLQLQRPPEELEVPVVQRECFAEMNRLGPGCIWIVPPFALAVTWD